MIRRLPRASDRTRGGRAARRSGASGPLVRLLALVLASLLWAAPAYAQEDSDRGDLRGLVQALAEGGYGDKADAAAALAATGDERVRPILEALADRSLAVRESDGLVVIEADLDDDGVGVVDPVTGETLAVLEDDDGLDTIRTNAGLRRELDAIIGSLSLRSEDPETRLAAARLVFDEADEDALPAVEAALAEEDDEDVRAALEKARAAILLESGDTDAQLRAIEVLAGYTDPEVRSRLTALVARAGAGDEEPTAEEEAVATAAEDAAAAIESRLEVWRMVASLYQGISLGSVLLLAAIGLAITFGVMGVINMAHGEMVMLGAYTTFVVQEVFRSAFPGLFDWSLAVAVPAAFLVSGMVGIAIERGVIRYLYGRPLETLLATWGISLVLQQTVRTIFGPTNRQVGTPSWMQGAFETTAGITLTYNRFYIILFALAVLFALMLVLHRSALGLQMRAVTQNRRMAKAMGIRTDRVDALTFGLGSGVAGAAGVALSQIDNVSPNLGQAYIIDSFLVVVFGGVGNLWGTFAGAMTLGVVNKFLEPYAGAVLGKIVVLVAIILFIQKRPRGLFALKGRAAEG
ncbi:MAG: urea ABC transporter permease subunit UrtB [Azospirillaceae bacterium]